MNRCLNCGCVFSDDAIALWEERHGLERGPYEKFYGCPICKGDFETDCAECDCCGEVFSEDDLYNGLCISCLKSKMTVERGQAFLEDADTFVQFVFQQLVDIPCAFYHEFNDGNEKLFEIAQDYFIKKRKELGDAEMVRNLNEWIFDDESWGGEMFSGWLKRKEV